MKKIVSRRIITFLMAITILASPFQVMAKSQSIEQVIKQYELYLNAGNTQSILKLYGKKPVFMPQHSLAQVGRAAVKKAYDDVFTTIDLDIKFTIYEIEINGNTAWARTSSVGKTTIQANGMKIDEGNNELFIFKKESGKWKIHRYLFSTTTPRK